MSDERTVRDFTREHWRTPMRMLDELGLDPDMSVTQLRADLAIAKRARKVERLERECAESEADLGHRNGFNACRDHILGSAT